MVNIQIVNRKDENTILRPAERVYTGEAEQSHAEDDPHGPHSANAGTGLCSNLRPEECQCVLSRSGYVLHFPKTFCKD
jgi:hypothetical protein